MGSEYPQSFSKTENPRWILASASPRRRELLRQLGLVFDCLISEVIEQARSNEFPREFAKRMAEEKALDVAQQNARTSSAVPSETFTETETWVIGGDTVVALGDQILGKPIDVSDAKSMLARLSGREHDVWSGWAIVRSTAHTEPEIVCSGVSRGIVKMRAISDEEIRAYVETGEPLDKAGSYGIQGRGGRFVEDLTGSLYGVIGLPLLDVGEAISELHQLPEPDFALRSVRLRERAATAAWRSGRSVDEVHVLAVSKRHPSQAIITAGAHGLSHFGESYLQELTEKQPVVSESWLSAYTSEPTWHYIGAIQSKKARHIGAQAQWVHGVSRFVEAQRLDEGAARSGHQPQLFIQVNIAGEASKGGVHPRDVLQLLQQCEELTAIKVVGLMTFPPLGDPEDNRVHFRALRVLRDQLTECGFDLPHLSMGTSHDFEIAIEEGATWVRLGRALFGERN